MRLAHDGIENDAASSGLSLCQARNFSAYQPRDPSNVPLNHSQPRRSASRPLSRRNDS